MGTSERVWDELAGGRTRPWQPWILLLALAGGCASSHVGRHLDPDWIGRLPAPGARMADVRLALGRPQAEFDLNATNDGCRRFGHDRCHTVWRYHDSGGVGIDPTFAGQVVLTAATAPLAGIAHLPYLAVGRRFQWAELCFDSAGCLTHLEHVDARGLAARRKAFRSPFDLPAAWTGLEVGVTTQPEVTARLGGTRVTRPSPGRPGCERWTYGFSRRLAPTDPPLPTAATDRWGEAERLSAELTLDFDAAGRLVDRFGFSTFPAGR